MRTRTEIVERARLHVGHRETATNDSPLIRAWLRRCGVTSPSAWCAAFASWCVDERRASGKGGQTVGADVIPVACAGALNLGRLFPSTRDPLPGDLMFFATDDQGHGHVGVVVERLADRVLCIEGNSENRVRYVQRLVAETRFARTREEPAPPDHGSPEAWRTAPLVHVSLGGTR